MLQCRKALAWRDTDAGKWTGHDVPDFVADRAPSYRPPDDATGAAAISGVDPFILQADGKAWLFAPAGLVDGPLTRFGIFEAGLASARDTRYTIVPQRRRRDERGMN
jgi:hypothetical protein